MGKREYYVRHYFDARGNEDIRRLLVSLPSYQKSRDADAGGRMGLKLTASWWGSPTDEVIQSGNITLADDFGTLPFYPKGLHV